MGFQVGPPTLPRKATNCRTIRAICGIPLTTGIDPPTTVCSRHPESQPVTATRHGSRIVCWCIWMRWVSIPGLHFKTPAALCAAPVSFIARSSRCPLPKGISDSKTIAAQHPWLAYELAAQEGRRNEYPSDKPTIADYDEWDARRLRVAYYGNCSEIDAQFGRVIDRLKAHGRYDETLIIFCSDHGEQLGDNGFWGRRGPYDGNFHVPMIIRDPRAEADRARGSRVNAFTEHVDILPTMLEAIGASPPHPCDGRSLIPFLTGSVPENWRDAVHFAYDFRDLQKNTAEAALGLPSSACHFNAIRGER